MPYKDREQMLQYNRQYDLLKRDKLKRKARQAIYYQKNRDKILLQVKQYRDNNCEKERERGRKYREAHLEQARERARKYREAHLEQVQSRNAIRYQNKKDLYNHRKREKYREQYPEGKANSGHW